MGGSVKKLSPVEKLHLTKLMNGMDGEFRTVEEIVVRAGFDSATTASNLLAELVDRGITGKFGAGFIGGVWKYRRRGGG